MSRPRKQYPFDAIRAGRARKFYREEYSNAELARMIAAAYRRRLPDGTPMFTTTSKCTTTDYVWVEFRREKA